MIRTINSGLYSQVIAFDDLVFITLPRIYSEIFIMKNIIAELLIRLAEKEEETKKLAAKVEALGVVVAAQLRRVEQNERDELIKSIEGALDDTRPAGLEEQCDTQLLRGYLEKILRYSPD